MSKTSVHVIPLLRNLCWLPMAYTMKQFNLMALASVVLCNHAFPAHLDHFSLFCVSPDPLNTSIRILFYYFCFRVCLPYLSPPGLPRAVLFRPSRLSTHVTSSLSLLHPWNESAFPQPSPYPLIPSNFNCLLRRSVFPLKLVNS